MRWSVVIPVYNERDYLPRTLLSLVEQTQSCEIIVVDNGSTDGCIAKARQLARKHGLQMCILEEHKAGQVHALKRGIEAAHTELIAICDADTWYPAHYLERAEALFDARGEDCVAVAAYLRPEKRGGLRDWAKTWHQLAVAWLLPRQNHTSGAAHCFRLAALRAVGGYDAQLWPFVIKDHELMNRVLAFGSQAYARDLWCVPSERRVSRRNVRWTLAERLLYHVTPFSLQRRFFRSFLAARFNARGLKDTCLRDRPWEANLGAKA